MPRLRLNGDAEEYRRMVEAGLAQVHLCEGGFAITEIREYNHPQERVLVVLLLGGKKFDEWKVSAHEKLKSFARVNGCSAIEFACRLGLEVKVAELGYRRRRVLMRYEMEHEQTFLEDRRLPAAA
jgi:hypothetical protein